jgi:adenylate cyclase class 1
MEKNRKKIQKILSRNKRTFSEYGEFRKKIFSELAPKESEAILYLLPWLLSINEPTCPGYVEGIKRLFRVFNIDNVKEIREREKDFKSMFGIQKKGTLLKPESKYYVVQGLYTIGSVGSVSQSSISDCDIWVCIDKNDFDQIAWIQLNEKLNLIKDWMDTSLKMPVYFFITDTTAIRECRFGSVDAESSGSTQQNVLKEEFYRTCMVICGKIPLWWLCYDKEVRIDYNEALSAMEDDDFWEYDIIDFGDIEKVEKEEYFGAALWQFHKSLSRPLKSIIKIIHLQMLLNAPQERLICHQFREEVLSKNNSSLFPDHSVFTMTLILDKYGEDKKEMLPFLINCYYMQCEINPYDSTQKLKNILAGDFIRRHSIDKKRQIMLRKAGSWHFKSQIELGNRLFKLLLQIYREISAGHTGVVSESDRKDLTILGRKISAFYMKRRYKIPVLQKPTGTLNVSSLTLDTDGKIWQIFSGNDKTSPIVSNRDIIYNIAFVVWNNLFAPNLIHMRPNPSSFTLQEIINLGAKMRNFLGTYETLDLELSNYLKKEHVTKLLVVLDFEKSPWYDDTKDFGAVYVNCWGEIFSRRFNSSSEFEDFIRDCCKDGNDIDIGYYIQRNPTAYEKIIERTKKIVSSSLES